MMAYKGYQAAVEFDDEAGVFHGVVLHLRDVVTFEGTSVDEVRKEFRASVDDYLEDCAERGVTPDKPYSGKFMLRTTPEEHRLIATACATAGQSLNAWSVAKLVDCATREGYRYKYLRATFAAHRLVGQSQETSLDGPEDVRTEQQDVWITSAVMRRGAAGRSSSNTQALVPVNRDAC